MIIPKSRILDLLKVQCRIFSQTYNPEGVRTGNKVLRQRLKGHILADYYPRRQFTLKQFAKSWPQLDMYDDEETERVEDNDRRKARGKGKPKKKKTAAESKRKHGKKR